MYISPLSGVHFTGKRWALGTLLKRKQNAVRHRETRKDKQRDRERYIDEQRRTYRRRQKLVRKPA